LAVCEKLTSEVPGMKDLARRAARESLEYGAAITSEWKLGETVKGTPHQVVIPRPEGSVGSYHTHRIDATPSTADLWEMLALREEALCIGEARVSHPIVRCHFPKERENFDALALAVRLTEDKKNEYLSRLESRYGQAEARTEMEKLEGLALLRTVRQVKDVVDRRWPDIIGGCDIQ
jgi:hypothetical protein